MSRFSFSILMLVIVLTSVSMLMAQPVSVGIKGGMNYNMADFNYSSSDFYYNPGEGKCWNVSLQLETPLTSRFSLRLDGGFLQKGFDSQVAFVPEENPFEGALAQNVATRINYVSFALAIKGTLASGTYIVAGPRADIELGVSDDLNIFPTAFEYGLNSPVLGLTVGVGQEFSLRTFGKFFAELQYRYDFTSLHEGIADPNPINGSLTSIDNQAFAFLIGFRR